MHFTRFTPIPRSIHSSSQGISCSTIRSALSFKRIFTTKPHGSARDASYSCRRYCTPGGTQPPLEDVTGVPNRCYPINISHRGSAQLFPISERAKSTHAHLRAKQSQDMLPREFRSSDCEDASLRIESKTQDIGGEKTVKYKHSPSIATPPKG